MSNAKERAIIGQGLSFPLRIDSRGALSLVGGERDIQQAIMLILSTMPGERLMRPEFGCRVHELVFAPRDSATAGLAAYYVNQALERWEPRIDVIAVDASDDPEHDSALRIEIKYQIKETHDERSIVFPFYLNTDEAGIAEKDAGATGSAST